MALTKIIGDVIASNTISSNNISSTVELGGPKIANVQIANSSWSALDDTAVSVDGGYIIVNGSGFVSGCQVIIDGVTAPSVTFANSSQLRVTVSADSAGTYMVYVVNPDGGTAIGVNALTYSATPSWVTGTTLSFATTNTEYSYQLEATGATSYTLQAGSSLPANSTLASNGLFSGTTVVESNTNYSFTVVATDDENQDSPRTFSLNISSILTLPPVTDYIALYMANTYTGNTTWIDSSGSGYHVTIGGSEYSSANATGNGASANFKVFRGSPNTTALWPSQILPSTYTLFHVTRSATTRRRVLSGYDVNWLSGHWAGGNGTNPYSGVAFHGQWGSAGEPSVDIHGTNWFYATDQNNLFRSNGVTRSTYSGGSSARLAINQGFNAELSYFDVAEIIVYNRTLNSTEYQAVEAYLAAKYGIT